MSVTARSLDCVSYGEPSSSVEPSSVEPSSVLHTNSCCEDRGTDDRYGFGQTSGCVVNSAAALRQSSSRCCSPAAAAADRDCAAAAMLCGSAALGVLAARKVSKAQCYRAAKCQGDPSHGTRDNDRETNNEGNKEKEGNKEGKLCNRKAARCQHFGLCDTAGVPCCGGGVCVGRVCEVGGCGGGDCEAGGCETGRSQCRRHLSGDVSQDVGKDGSFDTCSCGKDSRKNTGEPTCERESGWERDPHACCLPLFQRPSAPANLQREEPSGCLAKGGSHTRVRLHSRIHPRTIDQAAEEIISLARQLGEDSRRFQVPPPAENYCDRTTLNLREILSEEVKRLESKLERAECLEKEVERGLQGDRSLLERVEETLVLLAREESRLEWKEEEIKRRREVVETIYATRGKECVKRLRQEATRLRAIVDELEQRALEEEQQTHTCSPDLTGIHAAIDSERELVARTLTRLKDEKGKQVIRARELRTQIFDDRRKLDLMLEKHIHLVQEINRLKSRYR
ncbi:hypothetical protein GNI_155620 [Gregarina niphandrodes]|uniref:Uncharacterized protein n=1 Tax=Gregarina niphandrodes TaxID=110365 RepID=A0A023AZ46_GRENI|nr:hypothetical protein GNI_155620 [Gregarina niphandrodes]EZG43920.1 hypothetical protein GNI_155620 [Gregarina niphandrodes]|eukprot:XP_011132891.1 hypothetical protein GNI_155620 [Gregarina niphandrodes]